MLRFIFLLLHQIKNLNNYLIHQSSMFIIIIIIINNNKNRNSILWFCLGRKSVKKKQTRIFFWKININNHSASQKRKRRRRTATFFLLWNNFAIAAAAADCLLDCLVLKPVQRKLNCFWSIKEKDFFNHRTHTKIAIIHLDTHTHTSNRYRKLRISFHEFCFCWKI